MIKRPTTSIVLCTRNRINDLLLCLKSIAQQTESPQELIIIDSSTIPLNQLEPFNNYFTATTFPKTVLVYKHTSPGLTYQRNRGIEEATQEILYFFDDDVVLESDYLASMNKIFATHSNYVGGMGSITNMPTMYKKNWHRFLRIFFLLPRDYATGTFTMSGMPTHAYGTTTLKNVEVLGGCCMAFRTELLKKTMCDETLKGYGYMEDCDLSRRISYDAVLFYNPYARLMHNPSPINRDSVLDNKAMFIKNYTYLFFKNFYPKNRLKIIAYCWTVIGLFIEAILMRNIVFIRGYIKGIQQYYVSRSNTY